MCRIRIPQGTEICIIRPGKKKGDEPTRKFIKTKKEFETEATEFGHYYIFKYYVCLQNSAVARSKVIEL